MRRNDEQRLRAWEQAHMRLRSAAMGWWRKGELLIEDGRVNEGLACWVTAWKCLQKSDDIARWKRDWVQLGLDIRLK